MADIVSFPLLQVYLEERWLPEGVLQGLTGLRLQQRLSQPSLCELYFQRSPRPAGFPGECSPGQELRVSLLGSGQELFRGDVTALEYHYLEESQREVYLRAYDRLHRLRKRQSVRTFENVDLVSLARGLCKDLGLADLNLPRSNLYWPLFVQHNQNDLELLVEMAALEGMYLTVRGQELYLTTLEGLPGDTIRLNLEENLYEAHLEVNVDQACEKVVAWGWNPSQVELASGEATNPRSGRQVRARVSVAAGRTPERSLVNETAPSRKHADTLAQADLDRRSASRGHILRRCPGQPRFATRPPDRCLRSLPQCCRSLCPDPGHPFGRRFRLSDRAGHGPPGGRAAAASRYRHIRGGFRRGRPAGLGASPRSPAGLQQCSHRLAASRHAQAPAPAKV